MKVKMKVSTADRKPVGSVVEVSETEGRTLIAGGFATEATESKPKKQTTRKSEEPSEDSTKPEEG